MAADRINVDDIEFGIDLFIDDNVEDYVMFVKDDADKLHVVDFIDTNRGRLPPSANPPVMEFQKKSGLMRGAIGRTTAATADRQRIRR